MNSLKQQPLIAEVLPGLVTIAIFLTAYLTQHNDLFWKVVSSDKATTYLTASGVVVLFVAWIVGTILDCIRDLLEWPLDWISPLNWEFLETASSEAVKKLDDSWLAYYFLNGNYAIGILLGLAGISLAKLSISWFCELILLCIVLIFVINMIGLRKELKHLMESSKGSCSAKLPHEDVFVRLKISQVNPSTKFSGGSPGVGVFAITDIDKGTYLFGADDDETIEVSKNDVDKLTGEVKRLYIDFCVLRKDKYICPVSFNKLTPAWYLNDSDDPNVEADPELRFFTKKKIRAGDELTAKYADYSD